MVRYRLNVNNSLITLSNNFGAECSEWFERQVGEKYVFTCKTNPNIEKIYSEDEVITSN